MEVPKDVREDIETILSNEDGFFKKPRKVLFSNIDVVFIGQIIDWFIVGLKELIPDEKLRYKTILEDCIYIVLGSSKIQYSFYLDMQNKYRINYFNEDEFSTFTKEKGVKYDLLIGANTIVNFLNKELLKKNGIMFIL